MNHSPPYLSAFVLFFFILNFQNIQAQVGINTTNPQATLDIRASDSSNPSTIDGILIPKIDVFPSTNPGTEQQGLLVYLTTAVSDKLPGFYYWDHPTTSWIPIQGSSTANTAWNIEGNAETIAGTHFIGTTDAAPLNFRVDNTQSGRIDYDSPFLTLRWVFKPLSP